MDMDFENKSPTGERYLTLNDVARGIISGVLGQVHTSIPGKIVDFDMTNCTATVKPLIKMTNKDGTTTSVAQIFKVPVVFPRTKISAITFPINPNDTVLLLFAEKSLDNWLASSGAEVEAGDVRRHDLNDCIAIPGLFSFGQGKMPEDNTSFEIQHKNQKITIKDSGDIIIGNDSQSITIDSSGNISVGKSSLKALVQDSFIESFNSFISIFNAHVHVCAAPGTPSAPTVTPGTPAVKTAVCTLKTKAQ